MSNDKAMVLQWFCFGSNEETLVLHWFCLGSNEKALVLHMPENQYKTIGFTMVVIRAKPKKTLVLHWFCLRSHEKQWFYIGLA